MPAICNAIGELPELVVAYEQVKKACAFSNEASGRLCGQVSQSIQLVCDEIIAGRHHDHMRVDLLQGAAGTSTNMNINELIAWAANSTRVSSDAPTLHAIDHVNLSQSTNDTYPTAFRLALLNASGELLEEVDLLVAGLMRKASDFDQIQKLGRT